MRRFFYDTEFIEHNAVGDHYDKIPTIDLISIGIVDETGDKMLYEVSDEFDIESAVRSDFLRKNVLPQLPSKEQWISRDRIRAKIYDFLKPSKGNPVQLWAYYADYDHVALCWLFGRMIDLPKGMPMYTMDIKQLAMHLGNPELPKQKDGEHDALADARWNREAYLFLKKYVEDHSYKLEL